MTEPEITKAEREELLATHARVTRPTRDYLPTDEADWKRLHDLALIPRLLRALDAAEANYERCAKASRGVLETRDILFREHEALKAKLAALVRASQPFANDQGCDAVHHGLADRHDQRDTCPVVARLREALAAAKVPPDLDQLTR